MDELGRGTSPRDGMGLAISVSEHLIEKKARVFFATHFTTLGKFGVKYHRFYPLLITFITAGLLNKAYHRNILVTKVHLKAQVEEDGRVILPHTLAAGPVQADDYGIELASHVLSHEVNRAEDILSSLRENRGRPQSEEEARIAKKTRILQAMNGLMKEALDYGIEDGAFAGYIGTLRNNFLITMCGMDSEGEDEADDTSEAHPAEDDEAVQGDVDDTNDYLSEIDEDEIVDDNIDEDEIAEDNIDHATDIVSEVDETSDVRQTGQSRSAEDGLEDNSGTEDGSATKRRRIE